MRTAAAGESAVLKGVGVDDPINAVRSDGAVGRAEPGDVLILEDTHSRGHRSRVVGDHALEILAVTLP